MDSESERLLYQSLGALKGAATILIVTHDTLFVSALTDSVLCIGERGGRKGSVVRHPAAAAEGHLPPGSFGGSALRVLHDAELPEDGCFCDERK